MKCQNNLEVLVHVSQDVIIVAVVRGKNKHVWNTASVKTMKICDNVFTLRGC